MVIQDLIKILSLKKVEDDPLQETKAIACIYYYMRFFEGVSRRMIL